MEIAFEQSSSSKITCLELPIFDIHTQWYDTSYYFENYALITTLQIYIPNQVNK